MKAALLKEVRTTLGLGAPDMAALLGVLPRTYYRYERGAKIPLTVERYLITLLKYPNVLKDAMGAIDAQQVAPAADTV